jgi:hypothetical protein
MYANPPTARVLYAPGFLYELAMPKMHTVKKAKADNIAAFPVR